MEYNVHYGEYATVQCVPQYDIWWRKHNWLSDLVDSSFLGIKNQLYTVFLYLVTEYDANNLAPKELIIYVLDLMSMTAIRYVYNIRILNKLHVAHS